MKTTALAVLAMLLATPACHVRIAHYGPAAIELDGRAERTVEVDLPLVAGRALAITTQHGEVEAKSGPKLTSSRAVVRLSMAARTDEEAAEVLRHWEVRVTDTDHGLELSLHGEPLRIDDGGNSITMTPSSDFAIECIEGVALVVQSGSGDLQVEGGFADCTLDSKYGTITASGLRGGLRATTNSGDMRIRDVRGALEATTAYGEVEVEDVEGESIRVESRSGDLSLSTARATRIRLHTQYGTVDVDAAVGDLDLHSDSGAITVDGADGALAASTRYGEVEARGRFHAVEASSSSGSVTVRAALGSAPKSAWNAESGYGDVEIVVPPDFGCELDAETRYGTASCDFAITIPGGSRGKSSQLSGRVGDGGPSVRLRSKSGDVKLLRL